jgi:transcriptional regulator GlxA family with amidase domain
MKSKPHVCQVGFLLLENFSMMAFTAAVDALRTANLLCQHDIYQFHIISQHHENERGDLGISISVDMTMNQVDLGALDLLLVCGGLRVPLPPQQPLLRWLSKMGQHNLLLGGLWNGSLFLADAGLMKGYQCTVHPENRIAFREKHPEIKLLDKPVIIDGKRCSSAGASSALPMMLALIEQQQGQKLVRGIQEILTCDLIDREAGQGPLLAQDREQYPQPLQEIIVLMENNLEEPLTMEELAGCVGLSKRQVERYFQQDIGSTPAKFYLELRLSRARQLVLQTQMPISEIVLACGFVSGAHFSNCYRNYFEISPLKARREAR